MQQWLQAMVNHSPHFLILLDKDFKVLFLNRGVNGVQPEDIVGMYLPSLAGPTMELAEEKLSLALSSLEEQHYSTHFDDPYGNRHYFHNKVIPLKEPVSDAVLYLVAKESKDKEIDI